MESIMLTRKGNSYKILHINKVKFRRECQLVEKYTYPEEALNSRLNFALNLDYNYLYLLTL